MSDLSLAANWPANKVRRCLRRKDRGGLVHFKRERHEERFFKPIQNLRTAPGNVQGYGFAIMALCSLLIETIQSYKDGLPTTFGGELNRLKKLKGIPPRYRIPTGVQVSSKEAFRSFFRAHSKQFSGLGGATFYRAIRNGLLHQGQTKSGWTFSKHGAAVCEAKQKVIFRDNFSLQLEKVFVDYLVKLQERAWGHKDWTNAARKIWWLVRLSQ